jgi:hypothetical protein
MTLPPHRGLGRRMIVRAAVAPYGDCANAGSVAPITVADTRTSENIRERIARSPHQEERPLSYPRAKKVPKGISLLPPTGQSERPFTPSSSPEELHNQAPPE